MADHEIPEHYNPVAHKEAVAGYYHPHPAGLEVAPDQGKSNYGINYSDREIASSQGRTILGLRKATFFLSLALVVVILAAGIGGGVGSSIAVNNAKKSCTTNSTSQALGDSSSPTSTATTTATVTRTIEAGAASTTTDRLVVPTGILELDCPALTGTSQTVSLGSMAWVFEPSCGIDFSGGDIGAVIVYSFHDCMQACAAHNYFSNDNSCQHVTFRANQTSAIPQDYGNCWLKTGDVGQSDTKSDLVCGAAVASSPQSD